MTFAFYDFAAVLFFTLGLYFIIKGNNKFLLIIFVIGLLNKEAIVYLIFAYVFFNYKQFFNKKVLFNTIILTVIFVVFKVIMYYVFIHNTGSPVEYSLPVNIETLKELFRNRIIAKDIFLSFGGMYVFVVLLFVTGRWKSVPDRKMLAAMMVFIPYFIVGSFVLQFAEVRVYSELIPTTTMLFFMYLGTFGKLKFEPRSLVVQKDEIHDISFDNYVDNYQEKIHESIAFAGQEADFYIELKAQMVLELVNKYCKNSENAFVLDIGSGVGHVDRFLVPGINNLFGVDVEEGVISKAKINNPGVDYRFYNGTKLPFEDNSMDFAFAINVMHHVPPSDWQNFANEMQRVLRPGGAAAVFEHNPMNPLTRYVVSNCEFDRDAVLLSHRKLKKLLYAAHLSAAEDSYILFFPFHAGFFRKIENILRHIPLGAQHFVVGKK